MWLAMEGREKAMQINLRVVPGPHDMLLTMIRATFKLPWLVNNQVLQRPHVCAALEETSWVHFTLH